jgi:hypothetical protein
MAFPSVDRLETAYRRPDLQCTVLWLCPGTVQLFVTKPSGNVFRSFVSRSRAPFSFVVDFDFLFVSRLSGGGRATIVLLFLCAAQSKPAELPCP